MKRNVYAIIDNVAEQMIGTLMMFANDTAAIRNYGDIASDPKTMIAMHPEHFDLVCLGHFSDDAIDKDGNKLPIRIDGYAAGPMMVLSGVKYAAAQQPNTPTLSITKGA